MIDTVLTALYAIVSLVMVIQYFWITKPRPRAFSAQPKNIEWYGLLDVAWIRDCRSNARNVRLTLAIFVIFTLGNLFFFLHLASVEPHSFLYTFASRDPIIIPIIIAFLVAIYQVLLGELFFVNFTSKIKGTDMWILWILFLILVSIAPNVYEVIATGSTPTSQQLSNTFYQASASRLGEIGFLIAMAVAVTTMYLLWIYHTLFVQLSVNDGFSLPQFVKNIRVNILESVGRPRVLIQSVIIGPRNSGKSELRAKMADILLVQEGSKARISDRRPRNPSALSNTEVLTENPDPNLSKPRPRPGPSADANRGPDAEGAPTDPPDNGTESASIPVPALNAGTQQVEFGYRDIRITSPLASPNKHRTIQLCHYMLGACPSSGQSDSGSNA